MEERTFQSRIRVSFQEGLIEISGSEQFVESQVAYYQDLIVKGLEHRATIDEGPQKANRANSRLDEPSITNNSETSETIIENSHPHDHVYEMEGENVHLILNKIPGNSKKEQMLNLTYLYLFAKRTVNVEEVDADEVRELCKEYSILDESNFIKALRGDKNNLLVRKQSERKFAIRLTRPGVEYVKELIDEIEQN